MIMPTDAPETQPATADVWGEKRKDPAFARERVELLIPDAKVRAACLTVMAETLQRANNVARSCWSITLRQSKKIHFNVGRCLALGIYEGRILLTLHDDSGSGDLRHRLAGLVDEWRGAFDLVKGSEICVFRMDRFSEAWPIVDTWYWSFIDAAVKTAKQTPWFYSHSPGLMAYLREALSRPHLPDPMYDWSARRPQKPEEDDDEGSDGAQGDATGQKLALVKTLDEIRESVAQFNAQASKARDWTRSLLQSTRYWVFDPAAGTFGPSQLVGVSGVTVATYEAATKGGSVGASFDEHTARTAIERASEMGFLPDPHLPERLRAWGDALLGAGAFGVSSEGASAWRFLVLPARERRHWKIAPGEKATFWGENRDKGIIAVGWGQAGDPRPFKSKDELEARYIKVFKYTKSQAQSSVHKVWWFMRDIKPGDIIVANQGQSIVVGRGVVLGPAEFHAERGEYGNCLPVHWFDVGVREIPRQKQWFATILPISADAYEALFGAVGGGDGDPGSDVTEEATPEAAPGIYDFLRLRGFHFPAELVTTYLLSLKTKPFVILSGISGTGKTKLAQAVAEWAGAGVRGGQRKEELAEPVARHEFVSVRPDWLDGKEVLGFYNVVTEEFASRPFLNLLLRAHRDPGEPYFAILDEMNLARVEHYFSDLLSATESRTVDGGKLRQEALYLHEKPRCLPLSPPAGWTRPERCASCKATEAEVDACQLHFDGVQMVPPKLKVPPNTYITGTVNVDETTHMFSPKVLDRANVIEFNQVDLLGYGDDAEPGSFALRNGQIELGASTVARQEHFHKAPEQVRSTLAALNKLLAEWNLHFGYRVANEIALYVNNAVEAIGPEAVDTALDLQILQKVLPKLHGSRQKLLAPLWRALLFTLTGRDLGLDYSDEGLKAIEEDTSRKEPVTLPGGVDLSTPLMPRSAAKLLRMLRTLRAQGFVAFIE